MEYIRRTWYLLHIHQDGLHPGQLPVPGLHLSLLPALSPVQMLLLLPGLDSLQLGNRHLAVPAPELRIHG